jgi:3-hydroxybutyryl-CoA dehydrogenase
MIKKRLDKRRKYFMAISKIGVMGAGAMGGGIAQLAAQAGYQVVLNDIDMSYVDKAVARMDAFLSKSVEKGKMTEEQMNQTLGRRHQKH